MAYLKDKKKAPWQQGAFSYGVVRSLVQGQYPGRSNFG